ncbi:MAG: DUF3429 domain-containing protein [Alphaproteobacteria bacterium]|nr:DUF3429 domain-containing protein [Alphaproteobacteria bacterium]
MTGFINRLKTVPPMALFLGLMGLVPFVFCGLGIWATGLGDLRFSLPLIAIAYACLIASFLGGVRWGASMQNNQSEKLPRQLVVAIMPTLVALIAFMLALPQAFTLLIVLFVAQAVLDINAVEAGDMVAWYAPLRIVLSIVAALAMTSLLVHTLTH